MGLTAAMFGLSLLGELVLVWRTWPHRLRIVLAFLVILPLSFASAELLFNAPDGFSGLIFIGSVYRIFNVLRIIEARMHERYLMRVMRRTSVWLVVYQVVLAVLWLGWRGLPAESSTTAWHGWLLVLVLAELIVAAGLFLSTVRAIQKTRPLTKLKSFSHRELPSLSVCIPARNETDDLEACLASLLASDYPKLEILVYDDCSQNKHTPEIIRGFAHDGVRFIAGSPVPDDWLAKNWAYEHLLEEASGELILFCGVDIRFRDDSLNKLVASLLTSSKSMLAMVPERHDSRRLSLIQPMRYYWEFAPPRRFLNRPPVLSSCWLIQAKLLQKVGGFKAVKREIIPEQSIARSAAQSHDGYRFGRSGAFYGVSSHKSISEQRATAVRTRYPQLHRQPEKVLLLSLGELIFLIGPFGLAIGSWWFGSGYLIPVLALATSLFLIGGYAALVEAVDPRAILASLIDFPLAAAIDIGLLNYSMVAYELSDVQWKNRNVCVPVMHATPSLPSLPQTAPDLARKS